MLLTDPLPIELASAVFRRRSRRRPACKLLLIMRFILDRSPRLQFRHEVSVSKSRSRSRGAVLDVSVSFRSRENMGMYRSRLKPKVSISGLNVSFYKLVFNDTSSHSLCFLRHRIVNWLIHV